MTDDNQNETMPTPQPLPGQVFIRPGIDDRPDYEKTLTPEAKAALKRLAVQQRPRVPEASNERPEVQAARLAEGGSPLTAAAHLDAAVPNLESSFLDLRDPMTAPDGSRPNTLQVNRLTAGFALGSLLFAAPIAALDVVLIPQRINQLVGDGRVAGLALTMALGMMLSFFMNAWIAVGSDHTFGPLGRRTPWIISGAFLSAASLAILSVCDLLQLVVVFWLLMQIGYAMVAMPLAAAFGERVPDKFRDRADSWHGMGLALGQLLGILVAVYRTTHPAESGWDGTTRSGIMLFAIWFIVAGIVTLLVLPREGSSTYMPRESVRKGSFFSQYRPPKHAPKFAVAFIARMLAVAAFVGSLMAALLLGPIARAFEDARVPAVISCMLFVIGAAAPCMMADKLFGVGLYALIAGFAYAMYDGTSQSLNLATLPDVRSVGRSLAAFSVANTLGSLLGVIAGALAITALAAYLPLFGVAIGFMLLAGVLTMLLK